MLSKMQKAEVLKQIASNPNIPSPPTVVLRVLDQASKADCTINDLSQIIQMDPGLAGNILRIINSAMYGLSRPVTSIQRALAVVGLNSARLLVLAISFPRMQKSFKLDAALKQRYWKSSIAGAIVARELSRRQQGRDAEDDMAAGLLRDMGEMLLQQLFPDRYQEVLLQPAEAYINGQCQLEEEHCGLDHAEVCAFVLNRWRLPSDMTEAVRWHHHPEQGTYTTINAEELAYLLHFATRSAQLLLFPDHLMIFRDLLELAESRYGMNEEAVRNFLIPLSRKTTDFAALLQVDIGDCNDYQTVMTQASEELVHLTLAADRDTQRALETTRRAETEARHWKQEAVFDPLTKVFNRRFLESKLREMFDRTSNSRPTFGILFIDLDGFKILNDRCGHLFGDYVLQQVADCLNRQVRQGDIVARYGGDEFCVLFEPKDDAGVHSLAQRVWEKLNELVIRQGPHEGKVGASIGAVRCDSSSNFSAPDALLAAADAAMYQAKTHGKNRVVYMGGLSGILQTKGAVESKW
jgi:diguanylate cyclase (GGDEF)-like protein